MNCHVAGSSFFANSILREEIDWIQNQMSVRLCSGGSDSIRAAVQTPDLAKLQKGDAAEWRLAFDWLYPTALAVARNKIGGMHPGEVEDVALTAIEVVINKAPDVQEVGELKKLLAAITHNKAVDLIRKLPAPTMPATGEDEADLPFDPPDSTSPLDELDHQELAGLIGKCLSELQEKCQQMLRGAFIEQLKHKELAEKLDMPIGSVGVIISRCLKKMAEIAKNSGIQEELRVFLD